MNKNEKLNKLKSCFPVELIMTGVDDHTIGKYTTLRELKKADPMLVSFVSDDLFIPINDQDSKKLLEFYEKGFLDLWYVRSGLKLMRIKQ